MRLNDMRDNPGSRKMRTRVGRGIGSGIGKTAGRGGKGQTARTGVAINGFEGGQMPLYRRLPKRGFNVPFPKFYNEINVGNVQGAVDAGRIDATKPITNEVLVEAGILRRPQDGLRLLGQGEVTSKLMFTVIHATAKARATVEAAGGSITVIEPKVDADAEAKRAKRAAKRTAPAGKKGAAEA
jgi:large subunit ribosomal protein L15